MKARDFIKNTLEQMWEDMQTDPAYWPDPFALTHLGKIVAAQMEMAENEAKPENVA